MCRVGTALRDRRRSGRLVDRVVVTGRSTRLVTAGMDDVVVAAAPSVPQAAAATSGLRHLSWVRVVVREGAVVAAELAGVTRHPVRRGVSVPAALHLASTGVPTVVERVV